MKHTIAAALTLLALTSCAASNDNWVGHPPDRTYGGSYRSYPTVSERAPLLQRCPVCWVQRHAAAQALDRHTNSNVGYGGWFPND